MNGKPQRHWLVSLHVLTEMEMSLSSFLMGFVCLCIIMNALFLTSCPPHPYPSPRPVPLCLSLPPDLQSYISLLSSPCGSENKPRGQDVAQTESSACLLMTVCLWFVCCRLRTETGNSKRSWSWPSRSCSRPSARQRLCLRWKQS